MPGYHDPYNDEARGWATAESFDSRQGQDVSAFIKISTPGLVPTFLLFSAYCGAFCTWETRTGCEADRSPSPGVEVKDGVELG